MIQQALTTCQFKVIHPCQCLLNHRDVPIMDFGDPPSKVNTGVLSPTFVEGTGCFVLGGLYKSMADISFSF